MTADGDNTARSPFSLAPAPCVRGGDCPSQDCWTGCKRPAPAADRQTDEETPFDRHVREVTAVINVTAGEGDRLRADALAAAAHADAVMADLGAAITEGVTEVRLREAVATELGRHQALRGPMVDERPDVWQNRCECGWDDGDEHPGWRERYRLHVADAVLRVAQGGAG